LGEPLPPPFVLVKAIPLCLHPSQGVRYFGPLRSPRLPAQLFRYAVTPSRASSCSWALPLDSLTFLRSTPPTSWVLRPKRPDIGDCRRTGSPRARTPPCNSPSSDAQSPASPFFLCTYLRRGIEFFPRKYSTNRADNVPCSAWGVESISHVKKRISLLFFLLSLNSPQHVLQRL